jgi:hypothetical protein
MMELCLDTLTKFSTHRDVKCRQHAVFCLGNLASNKKNLEAIINSRNLNTIITFAFPALDVAGHVRFQAFEGLKGLSSRLKFTRQLIQDGVLEPALLAVHAETAVEIQRGASGLLYNLSLGKENINQMIASGTINALMKFAVIDDVATKRNAFAAFANIAEVQDGIAQERLIRDGFILFLKKQSSIDFQDIVVMREISRCYTLFAARIPSHRALLGADYPRILIAISSRYPDVVVIQNIMLAFGHLVISVESHPILMESKFVLESMVKHVTSPNLQTRQAVALGLNYICGNPKNHFICGEVGLGKALAQLVDDTDRDVVLQAALAIRKAASNQICCRSIVEAGCIYNMLKLVGWDDIELKQEVGAALRNICQHDLGRAIIVKQGLNHLSEMMHSSDSDICYQSTATIANISESFEYQSEMIAHGIIQHLKFVSRSK